MGLVNFQQVKEQRDIETNELQGYLVDNTLFVPLDPSNSHYQQIQHWIKQGNTPEPAFTEQERLEYFRKKKKSEIKQAFLQTAKEPVMINNILWNGGFESANKINGAIQLAQTLGNNTVVLYDYDNKPHELNITDAQNIVIEIAKKYQADFIKKQDLYAKIENATTIDEINSIKW